MADDLLQGVLLSRKETKTLKQLKDMGNVKVPVQKKDINYYQVALEEFLQGTYQLTGEWAVGEAYVMNDFCTFGSNLYICKSAYKSDPLSDNPSIDTDHWELFFSGSSSTYQLKGPWEVGVAYVMNDFCTFGSNLYICKSAYKSDPLSDNPSIDTTHWEIFFSGSSSTYQLKVWSNSESYVLNDFCTFGDNLYICKSAYTSDPEATDPSIDTDHWELFFDGTSKYQLKDNARDSVTYPADPDNITDINELTFVRDVGEDLKYTSVISGERIYGVLIPHPSREADIGKVPMLNNLGQIVWETVPNEESVGDQISSAVLNLQSKLTFDTTPTADSTNPVTSGGIKTALAEKQDAFTIVDANASITGGVATVSIEQGNLSIVDLSEETSLTAIEIVLTNNASVAFPLWWFKIESGSAVTLSVKIGATSVGWLGSEITNIELGKTIEVSVVDGVACGGELL